MGLSTNKPAVLACLFGLLASSAAEAATGYVDLNDTRLEVPEHEVFACSADGWLISMNYEIRSSTGPVSSGDIAALEEAIARALAENITANEHDHVTISPGSAFRRNVISRIDPAVTAIESRNAGTLHIGLNDGKYLDMCPVS